MVYPDPVLRQVCSAVDANDEISRAEISELVAVLVNTKNGVGLSAPQIDVSKRFFAIKNEKEKKTQVYINPEITDNFSKKKIYFSYVKKDGEGEQNEPFLEGCLSIPGVYGQVARWPKIAVKYMGVDGKEKKEELEGYVAIVFQHELDHLNGILFTSRATEQNNQIYQEEDGELVKIKL